MEEGSVYISKKFNHNEGKVVKVEWLKLKLFYVSFRSKASGNCLYSYVSLALVGDNSLSSKLRILTLEFYSILNFIVSILVSLVLRTKSFRCFWYVLNMCLSDTTVDFDFCSFKSVKTDVISTCYDKQWTLFICISALSSVVSRQICTV